MQSSIAAFSASCGVTPRALPTAPVAEQRAIAAKGLFARIEHSPLHPSLPHPQFCAWTPRLVGTTDENVTRRKKSASLSMALLAATIIACRSYLTTDARNVQRDSGGRRTGRINCERMAAARLYGLYSPPAHSNPASFQCLAFAGSARNFTRGAAGAGDAFAVSTAVP
jgi:hypothetical protein